MSHLNDKELNQRIGRFMGRKLEEFPELQAMGMREKRFVKKGLQTGAANPYTIHHTIPNWHLSNLTR